MQRFEFGNKYIVLTTILVSLSHYINQSVLNIFNLNIYILLTPLLIFLTILKMPFDCLLIGKKEIVLIGLLNFFLILINLNNPIIEINFNIFVSNPDI